ncbi:hypothetical protein OH77DRAFT_1426012 [Trametes cingulata]|nr:hypothetical protein OH77DRAFT_1426012 [Trametes cingulata]
MVSERYDSSYEATLNPPQRRCCGIMSPIGRGMPQHRSTSSTNTRRASIIDNAGNRGLVTKLSSRISVQLQPVEVDAAYIQLSSLDWYRPSSVWNCCGYECESDKCENCQNAEAMGGHRGGSRILAGIAVKRPRWVMSCLCAAFTQLCAPREDNR